ncbi:MAG: hypothetical protein WBC22_02845 [Sedimentisphaerales bacterium]
MKRKRICLVICIVALGVSSAYWINKACAEQWLWREIYRERLQKSSGVLVLVTAGVGKSNVDKSQDISNQFTQQLQTEIELDLRRYGIKVLTKTEIESTVGKPMLRINLFALQGSAPKGYYNYCYNVQHLEPAYLVRNNLTVLGFCWDSDLSLGAGDLDHMKKGVMNTVREYINDYLAANPKEQEKKGLTLDELIEKKKAEAKQKQ